MVLNYKKLKLLEGRAVVLLLMVELSRLLPHQPLVLGLSLSVDDVGHHEGNKHGQEGFPDSPEGIGNTLRDGSSKCPLENQEILLDRACSLRDVLHHLH